MGERFCPLCNGNLEVKNGETYCYDPIVSVEVILYSCSSCTYEEKVEYMRNLGE